MTEAQRMGQVLDLEVIELRWRNHAAERYSGAEARASAADVPALVAEVRRLQADLEKVSVEAWGEGVEDQIAATEASGEAALTRARDEKLIQVETARNDAVRALEVLRHGGREFTSNDIDDVATILSSSMFPAGESPWPEVPRPGEAKVLDVAKWRDWLWKRLDDVATSEHIAELAEELAFEVDAQRAPKVQTTDAEERAELVALRKLSALVGHHARDGKCGCSTPIDCLDALQSAWVRLCRGDAKTSSAGADGKVEVTHGRELGREPAEGGSAPSGIAPPGQTVERGTERPLADRVATSAVDGTRVAGGDPAAGSGRREGANRKSSVAVDLPCPPDTALPPIWTPLETF